MSIKLKQLLKAQENILGINRRNIEYIYPCNPRKQLKLADDKALSKSIMDKARVPVPSTYATIEHPWELDKTLDQMEQLESFVIKPSMGSGGKGILILEKNGRGWKSPDGKYYGREQIRMHVATILYGAFTHDHADKAMVEERLVPHPFLKDIYDRGIPDVRVIVHRDIPVMAMLRIPTRRSRGKANLHQGALGIGIDLGLGELGESVYKNKKIRAHPDSGVVFTGRIIPEWEDFLNISEQVASLVPLKYLGVDLIMDEHRGPMVIEINARPGLQIQNSNGRGLVLPLEKTNKRRA